MRLFIAINLTAETTAKLLVLTNELRFLSRHGRFSLPENLHLTLVFLGECDESQTVDAKTALAAVSFEPFALEIERIGRFKRDRGDIWWAGVRENKALLDVQRKLTDRLLVAGFALDKRGYSPHITLGREVLTETAPRRIEPFGETVRKIELMKSERFNGN